MNTEKLVSEIKRKQSFLCIGLDVDLSKIPEHLLELSSPIFEFNKAIIDATHHLCVAYKPNIAFYEAYGLEGWKALKLTIDYLNTNYPEIFTIADAKRGDIGNTSSMLSGLLKGIGIDNPDSFNVVEDLISGKGIERIYSHLASDNKSPEEIIQLCRDKDRFAKETIELFIDSMAYLLSELALTYLPGKGIFLAGGLARSLQEFIYSENFMKNFLRNRRSMHVDLLSEIPIGIIQKQMTCLHGNLAFLSDKLKI